MRKAEFTKKQLLRASCSAGESFIKRMFKKYSKNGKTVILTEKRIAESIIEFNNYCWRENHNPKEFENQNSLRHYGIKLNLRSFFNNLIYNKFEHNPNIKYNGNSLSFAKKVMKTFDKY